MSAQLFDTVSIGSASLYAHEKQENLIATSTSELALLRYSTILTARWEASRNEDVEHRDELRAELSTWPFCAMSAPKRTNVVCECATVMPETASSKVSRRAGKRLQRMDAIVHR
jgi:hypothetical protein